jgi:hypothetical protein
MARAGCGKSARPVRRGGSRSRASACRLLLYSTSRRLQPARREDRNGYRTSHAFRDGSFSRASAARGAPPGALRRVAKSEDGGAVTQDLIGPAQRLAFFLRPARPVGADSGGWRQRWVRVHCNAAAVATICGVGLLPFPTRRGIGREQGGHRRSRRASRIRPAKDRWAACRTTAAVPRKE